MSPLAIVVFDFFVNSGPGGAARNLRNVGINPGNPTSSEVTQKIIDLANNIGDGELANTLISKRFLDYENIIQSNSKKAKFGPGWKNRLLRMQKFLGQ
jgi:lysozyme family protein